MYKQGKLTNAWTLLLIVFIFMLFLSALSYTSSILVDKNVKGDIQLSNDSLSYISDIYNLTGDGSTNIDDYKPTVEEQKDPVLFETNQSSGNEKDFAIEFYTTKQKGSKIRGSIQALYEIPEKSLRLLRIPTGELAWFINLIAWLMALIILIALVNFWKNGG